MFGKRGWFRLSVLLVVSLCLNFTHGKSEFEEELQILSKQVKALLDRRKEDLEIIEDSLRRKLFKSPEISDVQDEIRALRLELEELRNGNVHKVPNHKYATKEKNEHLTVKWLSNAVTELKMEVSEIQTTLNSTVMLQNREEVYGELTLLRTDVSNLNKELEISRSKNIKYESELLEVREDLASLRDHSRATAVMCGKTKNQLKATQLEWSYNWKKINENKSIPLLLDDTPRSPRHQRLLKKHVVDLEKNTRQLKRTNEDLRLRILKLEEEVRILQQQKQPILERIAGNEIDDYVKMHKLIEITENAVPDRPTFETRIAKIELGQKSHSESIFNLTRQFLNFDKLHMSMLELLENVESLENKVDKNFPEFRKEISKLEVQMSERNGESAILKEDQANTRKSVKAIGSSVSNLKDKLDFEQTQLVELRKHLNNLQKSSSVQTSKLHDHILKAESSNVDLNATKSAIHLVQELKSFEKEYKSIINKLPHDCGAVSGLNGVYLISPGDGEPIMASCQDGWTVIQKRYDGTVDFNRNWNEYSNGFGSATGEHWLGNRNIHYLTKDNCTKLMVNMKDIYGKYWQATYDDFRVADFSGGFRMSVDRYKGNASDALDYQNKMEFSTIDNDRDISNTHCASNYEGGWWFSHCQHANLNGRYNLGLTWFDSSRNEWIAVATSEMRVKRRDTC
ncbi:protein scabrous [Photinus pyralis]|nr:protein scabrous [Photinus pyralis]